VVLPILIVMVAFDNLY